MRSVTTTAMKQLDRRATGDFKIPTLILMENAGRSVADLAERVIGRRGGNILIVCGTGNNGGDGFAAARHLFNRGHKVQVVLLGSASDIQGDAAVNYLILQKMDILVLRILDSNMLDVLKRKTTNSNLIIDAIFGTGLDREETGLAREVISILNQSRRKILSIDIPSGLNGDTGEAMGIAVRANVTGTLGLMKTGMKRKTASPYTGKIEVLDISIPHQLL